VEKDELILLGKIIKIHGHEGNVMIALETQFSEEIDELELVFIKVDGLAVPFFISSLRDLGNNNILVTFDGYESKEKVAEFIGCEIMASITSLEESSPDSLPLFLRGFSLIDSEGNRVGRVNKIASYPMQIMLVIGGKDDREILIPLNTEWVTAIDKKKKIIQMALPDGFNSIN